MKNLIEAINSARREMPYLKKEGKNTYAGFNYVSIDDYYDKVGKIAYKYGIVWSVSETKPPELIAKSTLLFTYTVSVFHTSGDWMKDFMQLSVPHQIQGAQTCGSAHSYAAKCFMRSLFCLVTGEEDADGSNPKEMAVEETPPPRRGRAAPDAGPKVSSPSPSSHSPAGPPMPAGAASHAPVPIQDPIIPELRPIIDGYFADSGLPIFIEPSTPDYPYALAADGFSALVPKINNQAVLMEWWRLNMALTDKMKADEPQIFSDVKAVFENRRKELKNG